MAAPQSRPLLCVLLATHDSAAWLREQVDSIVAQQGVDVHIVASDDASHDHTPTLLNEFERTGMLTCLPPPDAALGSAHLNFVRLILEAPLGDANHVALADHDDIWLSGKLARAVQQLTATGATGYSSNVIAFWPDGRRRLIDKAQPQRRLDHLFSSPGPGCTFVLPREAFLALRGWMAEHLDAVRQVSVHDWLIYAWARNGGRRWVIDAEAPMLYRQHARNEIGANNGWRAAWRRLRRVRAGSYQRDVIAISEVTRGDSAVVGALRRLWLRDRLWLVAHAHEMRRTAPQCLALALLFLLMPRDRHHRPALPGQTADRTPTVP
jgi:rhamnosyltransferase